jgi:hypothetical protein
MTDVWRRTTTMRCDGDLTLFRGILKLAEMTSSFFTKRPEQIEA